MLKSPINRFIIIALGFYLLWYGIYEQWIYLDGRFDSWLSVNEAWAASQILDLFNFNSFNKGKLVYIENNQMVHVGNPCNAMVLFALFVGFITAFPGPVKYKLAYIPIGIVVIYILNVLRITALALNGWYSQESLEFNHKYTYTFIVYAFIFLLWMVWVKKFSGIDFKQESLNQNNPENFKEVDEDSYAIKNRVKV